MTGALLYLFMPSFIQLQHLIIVANVHVLFKYFSVHSGDNGKPVLLVSVPTFDLTHSCVLVNLSTLECQEFTFATSLESKPNPQLARLQEMEAELEEGVSVGGASGDGEEESILHLMMDMDELDED